MSRLSILSERNHFLRMCFRQLRSAIRTPIPDLTFEILGLALKRTRHRWSHVGNISSEGARPPAVTLADERLQDLALRPRERLRVATRE